MNHIKFENTESSIVVYNKLGNFTVYDDFEDFEDSFIWGLSVHGNFDLDFQTVNENHLIVTIRNCDTNAVETKEVKLIDEDGMDLLAEIEEFAWEFNKDITYDDIKEVVEDEEYTEYPVLI